MKEQLLPQWHGEMQELREKMRAWTRVPVNPLPGVEVVYLDVEVVDLGQEPAAEDSGRA